MNLRYWRDIETLVRGVPLYPSVNWDAYVRNLASEADIAVLHYIPQEVEFQDGKRGKFHEAIEKESRLIVTGPAGIGKSTHLKYLLKLFAQQQALNLQKSLPIHIDLGLYDKHKGGFEELVHLSLSQREIEIDEATVSQLVKLQTLTFLIDSLNEVPSEQHDFALRELRRWFVEHPQHHYIITARSSEGISLPGFVSVSLMPFNDEELQTFFTERLGRQTPDLKSLPPQLKELLKIPFFAEAFSVLCEHGITFAETLQAVLVARFVEAMLEHETKKAKGIPRTSLPVRLWATLWERG